MKLAKWCIYAVFLHIFIHAGYMNINGPFDLNNNRLDEVLLFTDSQLRYVEIQQDGTHENLWQLSPDNYMIKDAMIYDINDDSHYELFVLVDYLPGKRMKGNKWLHVFSWADSSFKAVDLAMDNGDVLYANNCDVDTYSGILSAAMGTPFRAAVLLQVKENAVSLIGKTVHIDLPDNLHNGFGPVFANFMNIVGEPHLVVFSPENDSLRVALFNANDELMVIDKNSLPLLDARKLLGSAIQKTDLNNDQIEELQLPFASGHVLTLTYIDGSLILLESEFSGQDLFILPDSADVETINVVIESREKSGIYDLLEEDKEQVMNIVPDDTLRLGDTLHYQAAMDTTSGFYSFHWLTAPPDSATFDPATGFITWIPHREDLGITVFNFFTEQRIKEKLISDVDELGDRHRILPVLEDAERSYVVIVVDTTSPPVVYIPPPYEPYSVSVHTPVKETGKERFNFDGEPSFSIMIDELFIPEYSSISHSMFTNLGKVNSDQHVEFSYSSEPDSGTVLSTMMLTHNLLTNRFSAVITPPLDTTHIDLDPSNWRNDLIHYPAYSFAGFPGSMLLGDIEKGISLYRSEEEQKTKKNSYISVLTPLSENRHRLSIFGRAIELWNMTGDIIIDSTGNKIVTTTITFSGDLNIYNMKSEMFNDAELAARMKELKYKTLEYMGVDSVAADSSKGME